MEDTNKPLAPADSNDNNVNDTPTNPDAGDKTQPTEEILNALRQINASNLPISASQETVLENPGSQDKTEAATSDPPLSEWERIRAHLRNKPNDSDSWIKLVDLAVEEGDFARVNETYEALLEAYPNTSSAQIAYINHVLESSSPTKYQHAAGLFNRYLKASPFVDLWKFYLTYVKKMNTGPNTRDTVRKAYEYALNHIGHDKESTEIWVDYIQFLKAGESSTPWDEGQKMDAIRKAYQRAVQTPMDNVKRMWEEYQEFENNLNKITAKKFLSDLQESHMQARTVLNQLQEHYIILFPPAPKTGRTSIWLPRQPSFNAADKALVGRWRIYLKWEESNPLETEEKDKSQIHARVQSVYRKAVVRMRFFAEIWYMANSWTSGLSNDQSLTENKRKEWKDEALNILKAGIEANPSSFVLNFAYAEALENNQNFAEVHETFKKFLDILRQDLEDMESAINSANSSFSSISSTSTAPAVNTGAMAMTMSQGGSQSQNSSFNSSQSHEEKPSKAKDLADRRTEYGLAWIIYMRFARRAESLQSARTVFGKARRDKWTPWAVYEAAALMEYHCTKATDVAVRIFEKGLEHFKDEVDFALRYLGFLISINDDANARALFERVVNVFPPERARPLWERWARYEYQYGNLQSSQNLERRMAEVYPNDPPIKRFAERHKYLATDAIAVRDLGFVFGRGANGSGGGGGGSTRSTGGSLKRTDTSQSIMPPTSSQPTQTPSKRPSSPDHRRRDDSRGGDYGPSSKRHRPMPSPPPRDRERWESRRRFETPPHDQRDHDRDGHLKKMEREKEEEKPVALPPVLSWFVGQLPSPTAFDGPVFRTDDLMHLFRTAVIPSSTGIRARSPAARGRPPPDYGPYQGPGRRGRY